MERMNLDEGGATYRLERFTTKKDQSSGRGETVRVWCGDDLLFDGKVKDGHLSAKRQRQMPKRVHAALLTMLGFDAPPVPEAKALYGVTVATDEGLMHFPIVALDQEDARTAGRYLAGELEAPRNWTRVERLDPARYPDPYDADAVLEAAASDEGVTALGRPEEAPQLPPVGEEPQPEKSPESGEERQEEGKEPAASEEAGAEAGQGLSAEGPAAPAPEPAPSEPSVCDVCGKPCELGTCEQGDPTFRCGECQAARDAEPDQPSDDADTAPAADSDAASEG